MEGFLFLLIMQDIGLELIQSEGSFEQAVHFAECCHHCTVLEEGSNNHLLLEKKVLHLVPLRKKGQKCLPSLALCGSISILLHFV